MEGGRGGGVREEEGVGQDGCGGERGVGGHVQD